MDDTGSFVAIRPRRHSLRHSALRPQRGHRASTCVRFAAIVTAAAAVLAGCTTSGSGVQTQDLSTAPSTSSATPSGTTGEAASSATMPSATAPSSSTPVTSAVNPSTVTSDPWPADLTPEQQDQARAALAALDGYIQVTNEASADPGARDWTADIRRYTADPEATQFLESIAGMASASVHQVVAPTYENPAVTAVEGNRVSITACVDRSRQDVVDQNGEHALQPAQVPRKYWTATVYEYEAKYGGWLVSETAPAKPVQPC